MLYRGGVEIDELLELDWNDLIIPLVIGVLSVLKSFGDRKATTINQSFVLFCLSPIRLMMKEKGDVSRDDNT